NQPFHLTGGKKGSHPEANVDRDATPFLPLKAVSPAAGTVAWSRAGTWMLLTDIGMTVARGRTTPISEASCMRRGRKSAGTVKPPWVPVWVLRAAFWSPSFV